MLETGGNLTMAKTERNRNELSSIMIRKTSRKLLKMAATVKGKKLTDFLDEIALRESVEALGKETVEQVLEAHKD